MPTNLNPTYLQSITPSDSKTPRGKTPYIIGRVTSIVQGPFIAGTRAIDTDYNNPSDLGKIRYELIQGTQGSSQDSGGNPPARPLSFTLKQYPLVGEIVLIFPGPSIKLNQNKNEQEFYYLTPYNIWGASHHNAFPNLADYASFSNKVNQSYEQTSTFNQTTNLSTSASVNFPLGYGFLEKADIKPLRLFTGDTTIEGRWGNSIRFGSTTIKTNSNNWSDTGSIGDPITIIRNGQGPQVAKVGYVPTIEDINKDPSSIYLTQGQKIVIDDINNNFSLKSLGVSIGSTTTFSIPVQQQLTSTATLSALEQDQNISNFT